LPPFCLSLNASNDAAFSDAKFRPPIRADRFTPLTS
jgi:hypothetical protein